MYKYNLEPVLNHRKITEENRQKKLAESKRFLAREKKRLWQLRQSKKRLLMELKDKQQQNISVSEIVLYLSFIEQLSKDYESQEERVQVAEHQVDRKREDLVEAMKKRKAMEKLKEKGLKAYMKMSSKREQDFLNEVAIDQYNRKVMLEGLVGE